MCWETLYLLTIMLAAASVHLTIAVIEFNQDRRKARKERERQTIPMKTR
jgi:hypothetical protein